MLVCRSKRRSRAFVKLVGLRGLAGQPISCHDLSMAAERWSSDWTRAVLPLAVLLILKRGPEHGYSLSRKLNGAGFIDVKGGTIYPLLSRLEDRGLVSHQWEHVTNGPGRKVFQASGEGFAELVRLTDEWEAVGQAMAALSKLASTKEELS